MKLSHVQAKVIRWLVENKGRLVERSDYWEWNTLTISSKRGAARTWIQVPSPMLPHRKTINSLCVKGLLAASYSIYYPTDLALNLYGKERT